MLHPQCWLSLEAAVLMADWYFYWVYSWSAHSSLSKRPEWWAGTAPLEGSGFPRYLLSLYLPAVGMAWGCCAGAACLITAIVHKSALILLIGMHPKQASLGCFVAFFRNMNLASMLFVNASGPTVQNTIPTSLVILTLFSTQIFFLWSRWWY